MNVDDTRLKQVDDCLRDNFAVANQDASWPRRNIFYITYDIF